MVDGVTKSNMDELHNSMVDLTVVVDNLARTVHNAITMTEHKVPRKFTDYCLVVTNQDYASPILPPYHQRRICPHHCIGLRDKIKMAHSSTRGEVSGMGPIGSMCINGRTIDLTMVVNHSRMNLVITGYKWRFLTSMIKCI